MTKCERGRRKNAYPAHLLSKLGNICLFLQHVVRGFTGFGRWHGCVRIRVFVQRHRPVEPCPVVREELNPKLRLVFARSVMHLQVRFELFVYERCARADEVPRFSRLAFRRLCARIVFFVSNSSREGRSKVMLDRSVGQGAFHGEQVGYDDEDGEPEGGNGLLGDDAALDRAGMAAP